MDQLLAISAAQLGVFTRGQARCCGVTDRVLQRRVASGIIERVARHVFRACGSTPSWEQDLLIAVLAGGEPCVASHRAAAALHKFDGFRPDVIEVTVPRGVRLRHPNATVHESLDLRATDITTIGPIAVTTPGRTLIDLGAVIRLDRVEEAFDSAERDLLTTTQLVAARHGVIRKQGRRGVGSMAVILDRRIGAPPHSVLERRFLRLLDDANLPRPATQYRLVVAEGRVVFLDAAYASLLLGFELDGHGSHATRQQRAADNARASAIVDAGWCLHRFTFEQVMQNGASVVRTVRNALLHGSCDT